MTILEIFGFKHKKVSQPFPGPRYPDSQSAADWMSKKLDWYKENDPKNAHILFSPASGDYLPLSVHVGSSYRPEHQIHYRNLKKANPDLVNRAKEVTTGIAGGVSLSRVGDPEDYHGMS